MGVALLALPGACKKEKKQETPTPTPESVKPQEATPTEKPAPEAARPPAPKCVLDGNYRLRFESNGTKGWWFRASVAGDKAKLLEDVNVLGMKAGDLKVAKDEAACKVTLSGGSSATGDLSIALTHDLEEGTVAGTMTRTQATSENEKSTMVDGAFDTGEPKSDAECFVAGIYEFKFDEKEAWKNSDPEDDRKCDIAPRLASPRVMSFVPFGKGIAATSHESYGDFAEMNAAELTRDGECAVTVKMQDSEIVLEAKLQLAADGIKGKASKVTYQIVEDGTAGESIWDCIGNDVTLSGTLMPKKD